MKTLKDQATNKVNIVGKLMDTVFRTGKLIGDGRDYESVNMTIRVTQTYGGREETSEIPVSMFATRYTTKGASNPGFEQLQAIKNMKTIQNYGYEEADTIRINSASVRENNFITRSGQLINGWQLNTSFAGPGNMKDVATFSNDIFIMDMHPEEDREGDSTGRLIIKGGLVQYGENLDVLEYIVEQPEAVEYIERNWNVNDTVNVQGRIRVTSVEEKKSGSNSSWGEDIPEMTTRTIRELIITKGDDEGREEEFAYDPDEIKKGFNARQARIQQMQLEASQRAKTSDKKAATTTAAKYDWE